MQLTDSAAGLPHVPHFLGFLPDGPEGVRLTLDIMRKLVKQYRADPRVRLQAERIIDHVPAKDFTGEAEAVHAWVRDNIRYTRDPADTEMLKTPVMLLEERSGDCDDMSLLTATLLEAIGHPTRFVACAFDDDAFSHVFVETKVGADWLPSDTTEPHGLGWAPPHIRARMVRRG